MRIGHDAVNTASSSVLALAAPFKLTEQEAAGLLDLGCLFNLGIKGLSRLSLTTEGFFDSNWHAVPSGFASTDVFSRWLGGAPGVLLDEGTCLRVTTCETDFEEVAKSLAREPVPALAPAGTAQQVAVFLGRHVDETEFSEDMQHLFAPPRDLTVWSGFEDAFTGDVFEPRCATPDQMLQTEAYSVVPGFCSAQQHAGKGSSIPRILVKVALECEKNQVLPVLQRHLIARQKLL